MARKLRVKVPRPRGDPDEELTLTDVSGELGTGALVFIVIGPVPFMVTVSGLRREAVVEAYQRAGLQIEIVEERRGRITMRHAQSYTAALPAAR